MKTFSRWLSALLFVAVLTGVSAPLLAQDAYTPPPVAPWDGQSRYNVLVLGMDRRPGARDTLSTRTDVMVLISYDPATRRIGMLHIPRDIHMVIPNTADLVRVNTLMVLGEQRAEGYGPYYAIDTIQANLGIQIDAYLAFDFEAFIGVIDAMGGITLDIPYTLSDPTYPDMNYGFDPFYIRSGTQQLDGRTALKYARTRHGDNDYLRGQRQMLVMQGVFQRLKDPVTLQNMLIQAPSLSTQLQGHIYTNVPFDQLTFLGLVVLDSSIEITTGGINEGNTTLYPTSNGKVRVPDMAKVVQTLIETFGETYWN